MQTETVRTKKYFYVLRPVLACRWVEAHGTQPPTEFDHLVADQLPPGLLRLVEDLLARKRAGDELGAGPAIVELNEFLKSECHRIRAALADGERTPAPERAELDRVFRDTLREVWGSAG